MSSKNSSACRTKQGSRHGLGLAIVQEIVAAHGGTITCESTLDRGTVFRMTLPVAIRIKGGPVALDQTQPQSRAIPDDDPPAEARAAEEIYLGFAAGVGKTYEMLQRSSPPETPGRGCRDRNVETHGRAETERADRRPGTRPAPQGRVSRSRARRDGIRRADHPAAGRRTGRRSCAHEPPGSRNSKRYQDVEELLRAGINVIATLNIQHLESLYDTVERATGVKVKERFPTMFSAWPTSS